MNAHESLRRNSSHSGIENAQSDAPLSFRFILPTDQDQIIEDNQLSDCDSGTLKWYQDPITWETMCDPIKCDDGRTYDRWTIIDNNIHRSPFTDQRFSIAFDDIDVRGRLFEKFPAVESLYQERRQQYRDQALRKADEGRFTEALGMLDHVLKWSQMDTECKEKRSEIAQALKGGKQRTSERKPQTPRTQQLVNLSARFEQHRTRLSSSLPAQAPAIPDTAAEREPRSPVPRPPSSHSLAAVSEKLTSLASSLTDRRSRRVRRRATGPFEFVLNICR